MKRVLYTLGLFILFLSVYSQETHLRNIKQLTYQGNNTEAYFSPNGKFISFQTNNPNLGLNCNQIVTLEIAKALLDTNYKPTLISTGKGQTTCSYYLPNGDDILYASTHLKHDSCPTPPKEIGKNVRPIYSEFDIFIAAANSVITKQLTKAKGYDAEATISPNGKKIVFTSDRSGDLELWTMDINGKNLKQITTQLGYDGGAFFSPDSKKIVFRASRPNSEEEIKEYKYYFKQHLVAPTTMELFICNADGSDLKQITNLGKANWAPFFHPSGKKIIFSSNYQSKRSNDVQLYLINLDGSGLEQITKESTFNAYPVFSPDGKKLIWSSQRNNSNNNNLFIADWVD